MEILFCKERVDFSAYKGSLSFLITRTFGFQLQPHWDKNKPMHGRWQVEWKCPTVSTYVFKYQKKTILSLQEGCFTLFRITYALVQRPPTVLCKMRLGKIKKQLICLVLYVWILVTEKYSL